MNTVRSSILQGTWYPATPDDLRTAVRQYLREADPAQLPSHPPALVVVPHAGYTYSGPTAGKLYGLLVDFTYDRVFVLAPSHRAPITQICLPGTKAFATPLGQTRVDEDVISYLSNQPGYTTDNEAHATEHAVEIQLPFLQEIFGDQLRIVPMLVPPQPAEQRRQAAAALSSWCDGRSLFVVSSDFTHYGASYGYLPFKQNIPEELEKLDRGAVDKILERDASGLLAYGKQTKITMCGIHAAALALEIPLPKAASASLIAYSRSGDRDGDYSLSVSYAALLMSGPHRLDDDELSNPQSVEQQICKDSPQEILTDSEQRFLLELARRTIIAVAKSEAPPSVAEVAKLQGVTLRASLQEHLGVFVTLTKNGELRGCIGYIEGFMPLADAVAENALAAASRDPRFSPVQESELATLQMEISILSPLEKADGPQDIVIGTHGIVLEKGTARAVFLPQVASEQGWDLETALTHLAMKAGLRSDDWRTNATFSLFVVPLKLLLTDFAAPPPRC